MDDILSLSQLKRSCLISIFIMFLLAPLVCAETSLRVGIYRNQPKIFLDEKDQPAGFYPEILNHIGMQEGWQLEYVPCQWAECLKKLEHGELDLMPDVAWLEERAERFDFNRETVLRSFSRVYAASGSAFNSILDLDDKSIAVIKDSFQARELREVATSYGLHPMLVEVENFGRVFELIERREVDGGIANHFVGAQYKTAAGVVETDIVLFPSRLHFATPKGKKREILDRIDQRLLVLKNDKNSVYHRALLKYFQYLPKSVGLQLSLTGEEKSWLEEHPVLRVAVDQDWAPVEYRDDQGEYHGISIDYLTKLGEMLGVRFEIARGFSWQESVDGVKKKKIDLFTSVSKTPERERFALFTDPYISMPINIFTRNDVSYIGDLDSLAGKRVAAVKGYAIHEWLESNHPGIELVSTESITEGLRVLADGEVFAYVGNVVTTSYYIGQEHLQQIRVAGETPYAYNQSMAVRDDWPILKSILQKALNGMLQSEHVAIHNSWMSIKYQHTFDYTLLWKILLVVAVVLFVIVYWNRRLARAEAALQKANERLRELDQLKSMFIASISHELRTPLHSIIGFTGILLKGITGELNPQQCDSLTRVQNAGRHLLALVTDVIDISKIEAGRFDVCAEDVSLDDLLQEAMDTVESLASEKNLLLSVDGPACLTLHTDRKRLLQCVINFLSNAVKYTERGTVTISAREDGSEVEIAIRDTGIGISNKDLSSLFYPFERLDSNLRIKVGGTGLGLYLTKKITTDLLQGNIFMNSRLGEGSTFGLRIPKVL